MKLMVVRADDGCCFFVFFVGFLVDKFMWHLYIWSVVPCVHQSWEDRATAMSGQVYWSCTNFLMDWCMLAGVS